jgi:hypothetical protein
MQQPQEKQEALTEDAGFLLRVCPRERQYAELGYLLPFYLRLAVKTRCIGPSSWHAIHVYPSTVRIFGYAPVGHDLSQSWLRCWQTQAKKPEIHACHCGLLAVLIPIPPEGVCVQALIWYHHC